MAEQKRVDDEVYCERCHEALRYVRDERAWRTKYLKEDHAIIRKCYDSRIGRWDHLPKKNTARLDRMIQRRKERMERRELERAEKVQRELRVVRDGTE